MNFWARDSCIEISRLPPSRRAFTYERQPTGRPSVAAERVQHQKGGAALAGPHLFIAAPRTRRMPAILPWTTDHLFDRFGFDHTIGAVVYFTTGDSGVGVTLGVSFFQ